MEQQQDTKAQVHLAAPCSPKDFRADRALSTSAPSAVLEQVEQALAAVMAGAHRSSNGRMGAWATPTMATMEQVDSALIALRSARKKNKGAIAKATGEQA